MHLKIFLVLVFVSLSGYPLMAQTQESGLDPSRVKWTSLYYKTYLLFFSMKIKVNLNKIPLNESKKALLTSKKGQATMPRMDPSYRIDLDTKILRRKSFISLWFDPNGSAFQRTQTDTGSKQRVKTYRILNNGYYSLQAKPKEHETGLPPNKWTDRGEGERTFNKLPSADAVIAEPTALYYLVSASNLDKPGDKFQKYIFTKYGIYQLNLHAVDYQNIEVNFKSRKGDKTRSISEDEYKTLHIRMNAIPIDPTEKDDFDFLGMKGDIDLYIDPETRVLVQISGVADIAGYTDIQLQEVTF